MSEHYPDIMPQFLSLNASKQFRMIHYGELMCYKDQMVKTLFFEENLMITCDKKMIKNLMVVRSAQCEGCRGRDRVGVCRTLPLS